MDGPVQPSPATPRVSVVIPTFNRAHYLGEAIDSVLAQTMRDLELIVVDDGSTDDTAALLAGYVARGAPLRAIHLERNGGVSAARNRGIAAARGDYIALLDSDDHWTADKLERQLAMLDAAPWIECMTGCLDNATPAADLRAAERGDPPDPIDLMKAIDLRAGGMSSLILRAATARALGPFDESMRLAEDIDYMMRAAVRGGFYRQFALVGRYRTHDGNISRWSIDLARCDVRLFEKWLTLATPGRPLARVRRRLATAYYRLAVLEMAAAERQLVASQLFVRAALLDPWVDARLVGRKRDVVARARQVALPWAAAAACLVGLGPRLRLRNASARSGA